MNTQQAINIVCALPAEKQARSGMQVSLMIAQLEEWDNTTFLTDEELVVGLTERWGTHRQSWEHTVQEYRANYPDGVAYSVVDGTRRVCYGFRYGFSGEQYISF